MLKAIPPLEPKQPGPRAVPRLSQGKGRRPGLADGNLRRAATGNRFLALEGRAVLHPGGKESAGDLHGGSRPVSEASDGYQGERSDQNYLRFRISPEMTIAIGTTVMAPDEALKGEDIEMVASRHPRQTKWKPTSGCWAMPWRAMPPFAREDYVEEAWRIVDPVLKAGTPVYEYEKGTWGPSEVEQRVSPPEAGITQTWRTRKISESSPKPADNADLYGTHSRFV